MHLAHPRTSRDDRRSSPGNITQISNPTGSRPLRNPYRIGISAGPVPGALTASGQHGHRPYRRPGEVVMRSPLKALLITGSLAAAILGAALPAAVATAAPAGAHPKPPPSPSPTPSSSPTPTLITSNFACSNGVCEVGPGNVGMSFAAGINDNGQIAATATIPSDGSVLLTPA
jgi:hypothetical protein